jgi:16S rRNA (cytosine967-C5)-methyltransferase
MPAVSAARHAAFAILMAVERGQAHSDDLLRGNSVSNLSPPDRHLTTALVLGVLRWQIQLDQQMRRILTKPNARLDSEVVIALRLGAFQLLHLDRIPPRAAIDESVELTKQSGHRFASGMVNAVLRKLASQVATKDSSAPGQGLPAQKPTDQGLVGQNFSPDVPHRTPGGVLQDAEGLDALKGHGFSRAVQAAKSPRALAPEASSSLAVAAHPDWMVDRWTSLFGADAASAICRYNQTPPAQTIRLAAPEVEAELTEAGIPLAPGTLLARARIVTAGDITATAAFREGRIRIQDEGSQLAAEIAGRGNMILDCCAAPGGKTMILAERNPQSRIVACEASAQRCESMHKRLTPFADRVECRLADATALSFASEFDVVLADVPCSGTGTLGRNPEIRHRLRPEDLPRQAERQRAILSSALRAARPGGLVIYSTCSLEPEENEQVIAAALLDMPTARVLSVASRIDEMQAEGILTELGADQLRSCITPEGHLRLLPGAFGTDGFFVATVEKTA